MAAVHVWTERRPWGTWDQCTECAYLMALVYGGFTRFPIGAYQGKERDALDAATPPDPPAGGSTFDLVEAGSLKRYGVKLHKHNLSATGLRALLAKPGRALAIAGSFKGLPAGHPLRRWDPNYTGGHAVCVVPIGGDKVLWLDPLAPFDFAGDITDINTVMRFAWIPNDAREALRDEFATLPDTAQEEEMIDPTRHAPIATVVVNGGTIYKDPDRATGSLGALSAPARVGIFALPKAATSGGKATLVPVEIDMKGGPEQLLVIGWVGYDQLDLASIQSAGWSAAASAVELATLKAAVADAISEINALRGIKASLEGRIHTIRAKVAALSVDVADD